MQSCLQSLETAPEQSSVHWYSQKLRLAATLALLMVSGCSCGGEGLVGGTSTLKVDAVRIDFGRVFIGNEKSETVLVSAPGEVPVSFEASFSGDGSGFVAGPGSSTLRANGAIEMVIRFRPAQPGVFEPTLVIESNAKSDSVARIELRAEGVAPPDCEDGNGCTTDGFNLETERCEHLVADLPCDDFNACTANDRCVEGICLGESLNCNDEDVCTDDLCDPQQGCVHPSTAACADDNPCTADICDAEAGCVNPVAADGTPCDDIQPCTIADICLRGLCVGVPIPEGTGCNDGDPCSHEERCVDGSCVDPGYNPPVPGELHFVTEVGPLARGATQNPLVDRDGTIFVGIEGGVAAVDQCGALLFKNDQVGPVRFSGAVTLPGRLLVPVDQRVVDIDSRTGTVTSSLDLGVLFPPPTSSTATSAIRVLDLALRASGAMVASVVREQILNDLVVEREGLIAEIDRGLTVTTTFQDLGRLVATRLAIDLDEATVAIVRDGAPDKGTEADRVVRFGIDGLPATSWTTNEVLTRRSDLSIGENSQIRWTAGLIEVARTGDPSVLVRPSDDPDEIEAGAPIIAHGKIFTVVAVQNAPAANPGFGPEPTHILLVHTASTAEVIAEFPLPGGADRMSPVVDQRGNVFVMTEDGRLWFFDIRTGMQESLQLPVGGNLNRGAALTITPQLKVILVAQDRVFAIQSIAPLSNSAWPRHRRDNFGTGHR